MRALIIFALFVAAAIGALWPERITSAQFIDRIVRGCASGAVTQASVIVNPNGSGNIDATPCTGGSFTVNGVPVIPNGLPDPGSNGFVVRTAANTTAARTLGGSNGITISNGSGVAGNPDIAGVNALADAATKGVSTYTANDFDSAAGLISLDYTNGQKASAAVPGFLSAANWSTFNAKQPAGSYITALTGDGTAAGPGSAALTLATVNGNVGSFGSATQAPQFTVNAKGLITAVANVTVTPAFSSVTGKPTTLAGYGITDGQLGPLTGDVTTSGAAATLANSGVTAGTCTACNLTIDAKGRITVKANGSAGITNSAGATVLMKSDGVNAIASTIYETSSSGHVKFIGDVGGALFPQLIDLDYSNIKVSLGDTAPVQNNGTTVIIADLTQTVTVNKSFIVSGSGGASSTVYKTATNCTDSAGAAACGSAAAGSVVIDAGATAVVVSTTAVTANSQVFAVFDSSLGTRLGITCNTTAALPFVTARTAGTSFTISIAAGPVVNPACFSYFIVN